MRPAARTLPGPPVCRRSSRKACTSSVNLCRPGEDGSTVARARAPLWLADAARGLRAVSRPARRAPLAYHRARTRHADASPRCPRPARARSHRVRSRSPELAGVRPARSTASRAIWVTGLMRPSCQSVALEPVAGCAEARLHEHLARFPRAGSSPPSAPAPAPARQTRHAAQRRLAVHRPDLNRSQRGMWTDVPPEECVVPQTARRASASTLSAYSS